ncbi:MAG: succinate dehydrogenase iron-sulfur subunit [Chlamydiales bacterium]|nr:succinate dehydrogenase iron-sulfur subunit [Chlamydiales bacterium]
MKQMFILKIFRGIPKQQYWEEFELERKPFYNVISALMDIQKHPVNRRGQKVEPVAWEQGCLEEVCGSCSMLINGKPRQSCTAMVDDIIQKTGSTTITLAPFSKFPLVRDLHVDRSTMFDDLIKIKGWIDTEGSPTNSFGPRISQKKQETMYVLSTCMTCGCCLEACPQVNNRSKFMGPAAISQVRLFNLNPTGGMQQEERLHPLMGEGGIADCGNAQNCVQVCPKEIPLTESIAVMGREATKQAVNDFFSSPERN